MQSKVWPIILLAVPSISRAPTLGERARDVARRRSSPSSSGLPAGPDRRISAVASTALPGAWPWALMTARSGGVQLGELMSTTNRALMNPMPTLAVALKWSSSTTSIDSTPGPHWPDLVGVDEERPDPSRGASISTVP